jgi:hypothetical protein
MNCGYEVLYEVLYQAGMTWDNTSPVPGTSLVGTQGKKYKTRYVPALYQFQ